MAPGGWEYEATPFIAASTYMYNVPPSADTLLHLDDIIDLPGSIDHQPSSPKPPAAAAPPLYSYPQFTSTAEDLFLPECEIAAELEWLSNFVDDSFSSHSPAAVAYYNSPVATAQLSDPQPPNNRGARSKRSRAVTPSCHPTTAAGATTVWSRLAHSMSATTTSSSSSSSDFPQTQCSKKAVTEEGGGVRRCTHCASDKTPQWRTGPMGPKSLCNACGVRYKSGRLVPEYRPAASPTFVLTQHSNSHRKVLELRRQKELLHPAAA